MGFWTRRRRAADVTVIFRGVPTLPEENFSSKQGGRIVFGRDGSVFMTMGDRDGNRKADYVQALAQHLDNHAGKIIHLTPEGLPAADNPFLKTPGALPEIWALGIRSPEGFAMDPKPATRGKPSMVRAAATNST